MNKSDWFCVGWGFGIFYCMVMQHVFSSLATKQQSEPDNQGKTENIRLPSLNKARSILNDTECSAYFDLRSDGSPYIYDNTVAVDGNLTAEQLLALAAFVLDKQGEQAE